MTDQLEHEGQCPRCASDEVERELVRHTTNNVVAGVIFFCNTCALTSKVLSSDREMWYDTHQLWASNGVSDDTLEAFLARWDKKVECVSYGGSEPLGPILPKV